MDMTPRYVPNQVMTPHGMRPVVGCTVHPAGNHPKGCPIVNTMAALECRTDSGSRWFGVVDGWINSELKMVIRGTEPRDEVRMRWEPCTEA